MRDIYQACGYDFHYYKGEPVDEAWVEDRIAHFTTLNGWITRSLREIYRARRAKGERVENEEEKLRRHIEALDENRLRIARLLLKNPRFVSYQGQPLRMIPVLRPDPALLEQPLYH